MSRVNRAIELLEQGQPIYYSGGGELSYDGGLNSRTYMGRLHRC